MQKRKKLDGAARHREADRRGRALAEKRRLAGSDQGKIVEKEGRDTPREKIPSPPQDEENGEKKENDA